MDLVTTAPSVIYKIHKTNGEVIDLTNPTNMPDPAEIDYMEEPMVKAEIMVIIGIYRCDHGSLSGTQRHLSGNGIYRGKTCRIELSSSAE